MDVQTRWNSTIAHINSVIAAKLVIEEFAIDISQKEWLPVDRLSSEDIAMLQEMTPTLAVRFSKRYRVRTRERVHSIERCKSGGEAS